MDLLKNIKENNALLPLFTRGISAVYDSGVFSFLRQQGQTQSANSNSPNYVMELAAQAEYSRGYNAALDDILNFREKYLDPTDIKKTTPDYGAIDAAEKAGDLTKKEADELRKQQ
jgi:hypothetical protein